MWVFNDPKVGLVQEPFVSGADTIIDRIVVGVPNAQSRFTVIFPASRFQNTSGKLVWRRGESGGNWTFSTFNLTGAMSLSEMQTEST